MSPARDISSKAWRGRLSARPADPAVALKEAPKGLFTLDQQDGHDAILYVPPSYQPDTPLPLVLMLHGAGGNARGGLEPFLPLADMANLILLAPSSGDQTWDVIRGGFGPDVSYIDNMLGQAFAWYAVDTSYLGIAGFSDGASYALSLGLTNGDLFTHIIAFSPGFMAPASHYGTPRIYISHGTRDAVLPINRCSRRIVPQLQQEHYDVHYCEFDGPHTVPIEAVRGAWQWFYQ
ncbi:serine esterase [Dictyobacter sp. S3.2.2.5]|uniref:Serine esterase n=1 Tax=Dictyobacter halimunensis TaxID=3026934 RepID=A0ABQ6G6A5_9CHLR|nr:serine esterase [Dictyobacter sp. S3.2.2.5]